MKCFKIYFSVFIIYITSLLLYTLYINICYNLQISIILICKLGNALNANEVCPWIPMKKCLLIMLILMLLDLNTGYADTDADLCIRIISLAVPSLLISIGPSFLYQKSCWSYLPFKINCCSQVCEWLWEIFRGYSFNTRQTVGQITREPNLITIKKRVKK